MDHTTPPPDNTRRLAAATILALIGAIITCALVAGAPEPSCTPDPPKPAITDNPDAARDLAGAHRGGAR